MSDGAGVSLLTVPEAAERLRISPSKCWQLVLSKRLRSIKIDASRRVPADALDEFINGLSTDGQSAADGAA